MTLLGYFNSLRELGGAGASSRTRSRTRLKGYGAAQADRREARACFQDRKTFSEVVELTSRVPTDKVAEARRRLEAPFHENETGSTARSRPT